VDGGEQLAGVLSTTRKLESAIRLSFLSIRNSHRTIPPSKPVGKILAAKAWAMIHQLAESQGRRSHTVNRNPIRLINADPI
jgi:hypothetical protein